MPSKTSLVLIAHENEPLLQSAITMVRAQTLQPYELIVCYSNIDIILSPDIIWTKHANREDFGYEKRAAGLGMARGEWICWWNFDDLYEPEYLERMEALMDEADVVHTYFKYDKPGAVHTLVGGAFQSGYSDAGSFIIRRDLALSVGYTDRHSCADGDFMTRVLNHSPRIKRLETPDKPLMVKR